MLRGHMFVTSALNVGKIFALLSLMEMFKSNDSLQLAYICDSMQCQQLLYVNLTMTEPSRLFYVKSDHFWK